MIPQCKKNKNIYSTEEEIIGKWYDGKTLYRRIFTYTVSSVGIKVVANLSSLNIENVTDIRGTWKLTNGSVTSLNIYDKTSGSIEYSFTMFAGDNHTILCIIDGANFVGRTATIIIEYTKTTD